MGNVLATYFVSWRSIDLITHILTFLSLLKKHCVILFILIKHRDYGNVQTWGLIHIYVKWSRLYASFSRLLSGGIRGYFGGFIDVRSRRTEQAQKHNEKHIAEIQTPQGKVGKRSRWDGNWPKCLWLLCVFLFLHRSSYWLMHQYV